MSEGAPSLRCMGDSSRERHLSLLTAVSRSSMANVSDGFHDVQMFYAAFSWRGWVAYA